jgi:hypothetical protein
MTLGSWPLLGLCGAEMAGHDSPSTFRDGKAESIAAPW